MCSRLGVLRGIGEPLSWSGESALSPATDRENPKQSWGYPASLDQEQLLLCCAGEAQAGQCALGGKGGSHCGVKEKREKKKCEIILLSQK